MRKLTALLLALALAAGLCACGEPSQAAFRTLEAVGARHYGLIYRQDDRIAPLIDDAMNTLALNGELSAISIRWLGRDAITLKGKAAPTAAPSPGGGDREDAEAGQAEDIESGGETGAEIAPRRLIVGVEADFNPMAFEENGALRGMSIDIADGLGRVLGWEVTYQPITPGEAGTQLSSGNIDCALGFDPATVRADKYTFGVSYMDSDVVVAVRSGSAFRRLRDVKGQRIGTIDDPVITGVLKSSDKVTRYASGATVYLSPRRCLNALDNGWCAAVAMDRIMLEHMT